MIFTCLADPGIEWLQKSYISFWNEHSVGRLVQHTEKIYSVA